MAFCRHCGHALGEGDSFCGGCGKAVEGETNRRQIYDGEVHKCPSCGEVMASFMSNCPSCGFELRGIETVNSVKELAKKIEELEAKREKKTFVDVLRTKINKGELDPIDKQIISVIMNFPIPNTKEDIQEFMILASANMEISSYGSAYDKEAQSAIANAWKVKHKQANEKAKLLFKDLQGLYGRKEKNSGGWRSWNPLLKCGWIILNIYLIGIPVLIYWIVRRK